MKREYALGLDFGTTHSYLAYGPRDRSEEIQLAPCNPEPDNNRGDDDVFNFIMPSVVYLKKALSDGVAGFELDVAGLSEPQFEYEATPIDKFKLDLDKDRSEQRMRREFRLESQPDSPLEPEGLAGYLMWRMRKLALRGSELSKGTIDNITVTVPSLSSATQRNATQFAVRLAGFSGEIYPLEEPVAAFLYHHYQRNGTLFRGWENCYALVFDFGGGTCDVSIIRFNGKRLPIVHARESLRLGGENVDALIVQHWLDHSHYEYAGINYKTILQLPRDMRRMRFHARAAKESLSHELNCPVTIGTLPDSNLYIRGRSLDREKLTNLLNHEWIHTKYPDKEEVQGSVYELISNLIHKLMDTAGLGFDKIHALILAGGSSQLWGVRERLVSMFPNAQNNIITDEAQTCIAKGAAVHQLYRHSKDKNENKLVEPTLAQTITLRHSYKGFPDSWEKTPLVERNAILGINRGLLNPVFIRGAKIEGNHHRIQLVEGENTFDPLLDKYLRVRSRSETTLEVHFRITEYGKMEDFLCVPRNKIWAFVPLWKLRRDSFVKEDKVEHGKVDKFLLEQYDLDNRERLRTLRMKYGIEISK